MLKTSIGYSTKSDGYESGREAAKGALGGKIAMLFASCKYNSNELISGVKSVIKHTPLIGCTSSGAIIIPSGIITSEHGFSGIMTINDSSLKVSVAGSEKDGDAREIGRRIAKEAMKKNKKIPNYFFMVASPAEEELYLSGIQDVIGNIPFFGGSAADDTVEGNWKIFCNDKSFSNGCAVAFFYTDKKIVTEYNGFYNETNNRGIITKIDKLRTLVEIDSQPALVKYASWINKDSNSLMGLNLLFGTILNPLGVKDPIGNITLIRHPMVGNIDNSMNIGSNLEVGTAVIQMNATVDSLINSVSVAVEKTNKKLASEIGCYFLVHCGGRKVGIGDRFPEVYEQLKKACGDIPFMTIFTFGEYGYNEHSANSCGGLMLSFTGFEK